MSSINWDTPEIADRYDRNSDHQFKKGVTLIEMMKLKAGDMVLDVGCGTGRQAMHVSDIIGPDGKLFGLDPSSYRIQIATGKAKDHSLQNMSFTVGRAEDLSGFSRRRIRSCIFLLFIPLGRRQEGCPERGLSCAEARRQRRHDDTGPE